uniref:Apoptotic protease-activating factor 1 n=1 Tax=Denticeps clupeoides TaxID=299321 RepID=A0AAY4D264_9TELE
MEERARSCLLRSRSTLVKDIKASYLMDHMISDGVLSPDEEEVVLGKSNRKEQAAALLEVLLRKDNRAYISFYNALVRENYGDLAGILHNDLPLVSPEAEKSFADGCTSFLQMKLSEGGVPQRPVVFVKRPELLNQIQKKLYQLQNTSGWVTVYGMAGSGKSVMASEALRDHTLVSECFPDGVHWLSVGQLDRPDLLVKMQSLCFRLDQNQSGESCPRPPSTIEEAKERLRFLILRRYPRSLLILDDIWDSVVLRAFDIQCRVIITTRDKSLTDSVSGLRLDVPVDSGLEEEKALEILSLYTIGKVQKLPDQALSIVRECKGSPLVVSLIGALLREFPERWDYYLRQLQKKQFKRIRKSSSYDYEALDQAMDASIQVLQEDYKELYRDLTVLEKDVKIPAKVLSVLWNLEVEEVEDVLQEFVNKSLLFRDCNQRPYLYYLHDLQLDFLVEQNRTQLGELHTKVVSQFQKHYKKGPPTSGDIECLYWIRFLPHHMAKAGLSQELYSLMFSLDWVRAKAQILGPAHLIKDYVEYGAILDKENGVVRGQFQEFLSLNGHYLDQRPFPDVVQLALSQPNSSEVYRQALLQAKQKAHQGALYLDWINKHSLENLSRLVLQPHQGSIYYACFSKDGTKIASCGANKRLRMFKSTTGEKLQEFQAHDDEVLCCTFSPDNRLIATCSSDRKVKVWNIEKGCLLRSFEEEHEEQINHCQFTNTSRPLLLATCSNDKFVNTKLWNLNKASSQNTLFGHMEPVNHCCFSPSDAYLATSSSDGTLKLFEVSSTNEWKTIDVSCLFPEKEEAEESEVLVKCSTWSGDGSKIICVAKNAVFVFSVATTDLLCEIRTSRLSTVQFCHACPNSQLVAIALSHYAVELWDFESKKKVADCSGHLSWVRCVQFSPDGSELLSCSDDQTIRLWETNKVHTSSVALLKRDSDVLFEETGITVISTNNQNQLQVMWNGTTGTLTFESAAQESRIRCTCICRQPGLMAFGQEDGTVRVLEVPSGDTLTLQGHTKTVFHCQFSHDGQTLVTSSEDTTIRVWRWRTQECVILKGHTEPVRRFSLLHTSATPQRLLSWSFDGTVKVWDMVNGEKIQDILCHQGAILSCDVSPDGRRFTTTSADKTAKVWSCDSWKMLHLLKGHRDCVRSSRFSWDGRRLATGDDNGEIRLWNVRDGAPLKIYSRGSKDSMDSLHGGWVTDLHFSPDSKVLVSTGGYIKWWNVETGEALQTFYTAGANLKRIHVSPDFSTFITIDNIGILYILKKVVPEME